MLCPPSPVINERSCHAASCVSLGGAVMSRARCREQPVRFHWKMLKQAVLGWEDTTHSSSLHFIHIFKIYMWKHARTHSHAHTHTSCSKHIKIESGRSVLKEQNDSKHYRAGTSEFPLQDSLPLRCLRCTSIGNGASLVIINRHTGT